MQSTLPCPTHCTLHPLRLILGCWDEPCVLLQQEYLPDIKRSLKLDTLKAFYVAKESYLHLTNQSGKIVGFDVIIDQSKLKDPSSFLSEASQFLKQDKKDLL